MQPNKATESSLVQKGQRQARLENERIYGQPLPRRTPKNWLFELLGSWYPQDTDDTVIGVLDAPSRSVWVFDQEQQMTLWRKGFFGKGNLSRSEPTWLKREINRLQVEKKGGKELTAEELTAKRRMIRKQFKQQRAEAVAAAEAEAEVSFASNPNSAPVITTVIPSTQTAGLNQQLQAILSAGDVEALPDLTIEETPDNMEHLQLSLAEAFFVAWTTGCLIIREHDSGELITLPDLWLRCQKIHSPTWPNRIDNPFLIQYVAYHHFRSLGWVVKSGIKFCVDYLLYKKGPVFHHAEFAVVVVPSYEDPEDLQTSPYNLPNVGPMSWQWFSTLNRANSQVMKTLVLAHITIPASKSISSSLLETPKVISKFNVREIVIRRFVAARMRD
ncbi:hypothetical protein M408DRAFT_326578 [Serendipita vermifera MAFF 305830]|uniref:tRNA-splicing endonuclease subunit Sen2 n=1 Tax=Serendipita vermifera MAFF 305830 TaxID=933852 RepID=A0A0C3B7Q7_SERVB|nr:hypothetical protein M408DRAFT_326578 [Serendipita vermifera MAFF 305830]